LLDEHDAPLSAVHWMFASRPPFFFCMGHHTGIDSYYRTRGVASKLCR